MVAERSHKLLLVGAIGYERSLDDVRIDCCDWLKVTDIKNIRDYDTIILDLIPIRKQNSIDSIDWGHFFNILNFAGLIDMLGTKGEGVVIVIGDPRFKVKFAGVPTGVIEEQFLHWTGIQFYWDPEPGDTVIYKKGFLRLGFEKYITKLNQWQYSLERCELDKKGLSEAFSLQRLNSLGASVRLNKEHLCGNRYGKALAFVVHYEIVDNKISSRGSEKVFWESGEMIFLPETSFSHDETIQCVLTDICGIETALPEPEWIKGYIVPGQAAIDENIEKINLQLKSAQETLEEANAQKRECRKFLKLLYEREYALEPVVRDILREFGADVEDPTENNKEDGWVAVTVGDKTHEGVLEIKSTRSDAFSEDGRKQLLDWIDRGRTLRNKNYKGLFIGNSAVDKPPNERKAAFSNSWLQAAELSHLCVLKTEDLYRLYLLNAASNLNKDEFWDNIFNTNGIFDMRLYNDKLAELNE